MCCAHAFASGPASASAAVSAFASGPAVPGYSWSRRCGYSCC